MAVEQHSIILFFIGLLISTLVIYIVTSITRHRRSIKLALFTAIIGSIVYVIVYHFSGGNGFLSAVLGGIAWLLALKTIYRMGWLKALIIAASIWIITSFVDVLFPSATAPL
jgi:predicted neutral ceramidase superfamily lipid hydrolase